MIRQFIVHKSTPKTGNRALLFVATSFDSAASKWYTVQRNNNEELNTHTHTHNFDEKLKCNMFLWNTYVQPMAANTSLPHEGKENVLMVVLLKNGAGAAAPAEYKSGFRAAVGTQRQRGNRRRA